MLRIVNLIEKLPADVLIGYMSISNISRNNWKNYFKKPLTLDTLYDLLYFIAFDIHEVATQKTEEGEMYSFLKNGKNLLDELVKISKTFDLIVDKYYYENIFKVLLGEIY